MIKSLISTYNTRPKNGNHKVKSKKNKAKNIQQLFFEKNTAMIVFSEANKEAEQETVNEIILHSLIIKLMACRGEESHKI